MTGQGRTPSCELVVIAGHSNVVLRCDPHDWQQSFGYTVAFEYVALAATQHRAAVEYVTGCDQ